MIYNQFQAFSKLFLEGKHILTGSYSELFEEMQKIINNLISAAIDSNSKTFAKEFVMLKNSLDKNRRLVSIICASPESKAFIDQDLLKQYKPLLNSIREEYLKYQNQTNQTGNIENFIKKMIDPNSPSTQSTISINSSRALGENSSQISGIPGSQTGHWFSFNRPAALIGIDVFDLKHSRGLLSIIACVMKSNFVRQLRGC